MIDTNGMYGNVVEEQDAFQLAQKRREAEIKAAAAKKYAIPGIDSKNAAEAVKDEIVIPDFPKEFDAETALSTMFNMQRALQNILAKKRGSLAPDNDKDNFENARRSGYFMMSTVTEIWEFFDQLKKDNYEITDLVKYEIIDAWHFVMNQLLYLKYSPKMKINEIYDHAVEDLKTGTVGTSDLHYLVGEFIEAVGELYQNSSYKDWKTYDVWKEDPLKIQELGDIMLIKFFKIFVAIRLTPEQIYQFYYNKNIENVMRQKSGGRYEK
jgi:hypothetical protein